MACPLVPEPLVAAGVLGVVAVAVLGEVEVELTVSASVAVSVLWSLEEVSSRFGAYCSR